MASFSDFWSGTPSQTQMSGWSPWIKAPGYDFSSKLYDYLGSMIGQPAPRWGGFGGMNKLAGRKNPYINDITQLAGNYMNLGMPTVFGQAVGSIGRFMNPSFMNPVARMQMGGAPNYFGSSAIPSPYAGAQFPPNPWLFNQQSGIVGAPGMSGKYGGINPQG